MVDTNEEEERCNVQYLGVGPVFLEIHTFFLSGPISSSSHALDVTTSSQNFSLPPTTP